MWVGVGGLTDGFGWRRVWLGSFNVNDQVPQDYDLSPWLEGSQSAELLVFGWVN